MCLLFDCPGLAKGKYYEGWLTDEEEGIIKEIDTCNAEYRELIKMEANDGNNAG